MKRILLITFYILSASNSHAGWYQSCIQALQQRGFLPYPPIGLRIQVDLYNNKSNRIASTDYADYQQDTETKEWEKLPSSHPTYVSTENRITLDRINFEVGSHAALVHFLVRLGYQHNPIEGSSTISFPGTSLPMPCGPEHYAQINVMELTSAMISINR